MNVVQRGRLISKVTYYIHKVWWMVEAFMELKLVKPVVIPEVSFKAFRTT